MACALDPRSSASLPDERRARLLAIVTSEGTVRVAELAEWLGPPR